MHLPLLLSVTALLATSVAGAPPPPHTYSANHPLGPEHLWVDRTDPIINIDLDVSMNNGMTDRFGLTVDLNQGTVSPDSVQLMAESANISPRFEAGIYVERQEGAITTSEIWINSIRQTTPNTSRNGVNYHFPGVFPRVEMVINRNPRNRYDEVSWHGFRQNAISIFLHPHPRDSCG